MPEIIPEGKRPFFWQAVDYRLDQMLGKHEKNWFKKLWARVYDMGQNIGFLTVQLIKGGDGWLQIPGKENCSSSVASALSSGFNAIEWGSDWLLSTWSLKKTSKVAPSHYFVIPDTFRRLIPDDPIRVGCVICNMSYAAPPGNMRWVLLKLLATFTAIRKNWKNPKNWEELGPIFRDGIKVYQRDTLKHPAPAYYATHAMFIRDVTDGVATVFSQEGLTLEKKMTIAYLQEAMAGDQPHHVVFEPTFLYT
jgi:hypothetical protein